jgi:hypothetical protein
MLPVGQISKITLLVFLTATLKLCEYVYMLNIIRDCSWLKNEQYFKDKNVVADLSAGRSD